MVITTPLTDREWTVLSRIALNPQMKQVQLARALGVTRSAINQIWTRLRRERDFRVPSIINFGKMGLEWIFGWAEEKRGTEGLDKFVRWATITPFVKTLTRARLASTMNPIVLFEMLVPRGSVTSHLKEQLHRFRKKPYELTIDAEHVNLASYNLNLGRFNGKRWVFDDIFKMSTILEATKRFADIIPVSSGVRMGTGTFNARDLVIAAVLERDYHASAKQVQKFMMKVGMWIPDRTLRRHLTRVRNMVRPYVCINNLGLDNQVMIGFKYIRDEEMLTQFIHSQISMFPKTMILTGPHLSRLIINLPDEINWLAVVESFRANLEDSAHVTGCIIDRPQIRKGLEQMVQYYFNSP